MFTVIFAIGRTPGWIANWREVAADAKGRDLPAPAALRVGPVKRGRYVEMAKR